MPSKKSSEGGETGAEAAQNKASYAIRKEEALKNNRKGGQRRAIPNKRNKEGTRKVIAVSLTHDST